jgi:hypothetical protein
MKKQLLFAGAALCLCVTQHLNAQTQNDSLEQVYSQMAIAHGLDSADIPGFVHRHVHGTNTPTPAFRSGSDQHTAPLFVSNPGFETGDFTSWTGMIGDNTVSSNGPLQNQVQGIFSGNINPQQSDYNARHSIMNTSGGNDAEGGFPVCPSGYGTYTARLGNSYAQYQGQSIEQQWTVTPNDSFFSVSYAVVMYDGAHPDGEGCYFTYEITDTAGNVIVSRYDSSDSLPAEYLPGVNGGGITYLPWQKDTINLSGYNGADLVLRFMTAGCIWGGHYAYCYVDADPDGSSTIGINEYSSAGVTVYPNPSANGIFTITMNTDDQLTPPVVFDAGGKAINAPVTRTGTSWQVDLSACAPGFYSFYSESTAGPVHGQLIR